MIALNLALNKVLENIQNTETEYCGLNNSLNRVLAENVISDIFMPPFNKAAVDGFACRKSDLPGPFEIIETIAAGNLPEKTIKPLTCSKIMTGAKVPEGADCVIMVEHTEIKNEKVFFIKENTANNIAYLGEDLKKDEIIISAGKLISEVEIAVMASVGYTNVKVYKFPSVCVMSTGNELVEPDIKPDKGLIRNSNSYMLLAQCKSIGINASYGGIIPDCPAETERMISNALINNDILIITGGVSMGDYDYVPQILKKIGFNIVFDSICVQPGKPTTFAKKDNKYCFALAGNPVSSFIHFNFLIKPMLYKLMSCVYNVKEYKLPMAIDYKRKKAERVAIVPVKYNNGKIETINYNGSAHIYALLEATGVIIVEINCFEIKKDEYATYRPF